jgi:hypothetical protein
VQDQGRLSAWRAQLARRYLAITDFHACLRAAFFKDVGYGFESHRELDAKAYRAFLDQLTQSLLDQAAAVCALAIEASFSGSVIARFQRQFLCEGKPEQRAEIAAHLAAAFPGSNCQLEISEVQP